jgi:sugar phosphate isomerase/epimerase
VPQITFQTANYVARAGGYRLDEGWMQGDATTQDLFRPIQTFRGQFEEILLDVRSLGFDAIDLWSAHLNGGWATEEHIEIARDLLDRHSLSVVSLAAGFGGTLDEFEGFCRIARGLDCPLLGGRTPLVETQRTEVVEVLRRHGLKLGIENHPEPTPAAILQQIGGEADGVLGTVVDTGWWATVGYDPVRAIEELAPHILHVHLKDVLHEGLPHETCKWGDGIVPVERCVRKLLELGYNGPIEIEHEPEHEDPSDACREMLELLQRWLAAPGRS